MKNIIYGLPALLLLVFSCNPITDRDPMGGVLDETELKLEVFSTTPGGNLVVVENKTPGIGAYWQTSVGVSTRQRDTFLLPYKGEHEIIFKGICSGGVVTTTRKISIDVLDHPLSEEWEFFAGTGGTGREWMWHYTAMTDQIWGNGGYLWDIGPGWTRYDAQHFQDNYPNELVQTMIFDLNGGANFTKKNADGTVAESGSFTFDMTKITIDGPGSGIWAKGKLYLTDATVIHGIAPNQNDAPVYTYDILYLDADNMVLAFPEPGIGSGGTCWYWKFKAM